MENLFYLIFLFAGIVVPGYPSNLGVDCNNSISVTGVRKLPQQHTTNGGLFVISTDKALLFVSGTFIKEN